MKNLVFKSLCVVLTAGSVLSMQSCNRVTTENTKDAALRVNTEIVTPGSAAASGTKAGSTASKISFAHGDQMGLWVAPFSFTDHPGSNHIYTDLRPIGNYADNVLHNFTGGFVSAAPIFYPSADARVDLYAVSPYDLNMSSATQNNMTNPKAFPFAIDQDQSAANGAAIVKSDIMTAFFRGAKQGENGTLSFHHRLSRVLIDFTLSTQYKGQTITGIKSVVLTNVPLKSLINITDTSALPVIETLNNPKVDIIAYPAVRPDYTVAGDYTYELIATPGTQYAVDDVIVRVTLQVVGLGDIDFMCKVASQNVTIAAKKQTNIHVNLTDQSPIAIANVDIVGWGTPIVVDDPVTTKLSNMLIKCVEGAGAINTTATTAALTIDGEVFTASAIYDPVLPGYRLQYDHKKNFGGYLQSVVMSDAAALPIITATPLPVGGLQIKGDPTIDGYSTIIGTMTFGAGGVVVFQ